MADNPDNAAQWTVPQEDLIERNTGFAPDRVAEGSDVDEADWVSDHGVAGTLDSIPVGTPEEDVIEQSIDVPYDDEYE